MFNAIVNVLVQPLIALWRSTSSSSWRNLPRPRGATTAQAPGANADRLLLVGSGIAVGYGVLFHDLGLAGHLARRLAEETHRGVFIDVVASPDLKLVNTTSAIARQHLERFDSILLAFGGDEASLLQSPARWRRDLESVLAALAPTPQTHIFIIGIPLVDGLPPIYGPIARRRATALNSQSALACVGRTDATYVRVSLTGETERVRMGKGNYDRWSRAIAPQLCRRLNELAGEAPEEASATEVLRQEAVDTLHFDDLELEAELRGILSRTRDLFGVDSAAVNIIDGSRQRVGAQVGKVFPSLDRADSICAHTILSPDITIVEDTRTDDRFRNKQWAVADPAVRFYAGYPIETPGGERVGALCVFDSTPRLFSRADGVLLRELALRAQALIRLSQ